MKLLQCILICLQSNKYRIFGYPFSALVNNTKKLTKSDKNLPEWCRHLIDVEALVKNKIKGKSQHSHTDDRVQHNPLDH